MYEFEGPPLVKPPPLPDLTWNPFESPRAVMEHRYKEYLNQVESVYIKAGYERTAERREITHCAWLAGYQVCRWSKSAIADHGAASTKSVDRAAVIRAITLLAKHIGLTLRPAEANDRKQTREIIEKKLANLPVRLSSIPA
jgi:hypothetical protein